MRIFVMATAVCLGAVGLSLAESSVASITKSINVQPSALAPALQRFSQESGLHIVTARASHLDVEFYALRGTAVGVGTGFQRCGSSSASRLAG